MTTFTREDFEHAARAAGYTLRFTSDFSLGLEADLVCFRVDDEYFGEWNPPDDDGDTLRLAVACGMDLSISDGFVMAMSIDAVLRTHGDSEEYSDHGGDKIKAVRYAVFKRAIAIGKAMLAPELRPNLGAGAESPSVGAADQQTEHQIKSDAS